MSILKTFVSFVKKNRRYPKMSELNSLGVTRAEVRTFADNLTGLKERAYNQIKNDVLDLTLENFSSKIDRSKNRFVVTTAVTGAEVNKKFLKSIKNYCKKNSAQLLVLVSFQNSELALDPALRGLTIIDSDADINDNLSILSIRNGAKQVDPITGLPRIGRRNGSIICPSPKQRLKYVATGPSALPHALMSTGAITNKNYLARRSFMDKTSYLADHDHTLGAIVVETESSGYFHFRQIQSDQSGVFYDLNEKYTPQGSYSSNPEILVLGDWHAGETDYNVGRATDVLGKKLGVKTFVLHDAFSATSCSHHDSGKNITLAKKQQKNKLNLKAELDQYVRDLVWLSETRKVVIVKSNHDEHLERYLNEGRYVEDPQNHKLALELALAYINGKNPLEYYFRHFAVPKNIMWLERDENYSFKGIQLGAHGDKGANGSKGGINSMENAYRKVVYGHMHTPEIMRDAWCVGTSTETSPDYGSGPSSWMNTHCLIHKNGSRQLLNFINNKFTTKSL